jgi:adenine-specific DNA-methyltransferase
VAGNTKNQMKKLNKLELVEKIRHSEGFTLSEKSELIELINHNKRYGLVWEEKNENAELELLDRLPVLSEEVGKAIISKSFKEAPNHILIEGDNLHALTALCFTHENKIDVIYIDPPYNTGNKDFKYNDTFVDKEDSYRHSKWLSFMSKRLRLAKRLLKSTGVIFISIDDYEQATLKLLCDEIFAETNFVGNVIWQRAFSPINLKKTISQNHDFILIYCKQDFQSFTLNKLPRSEEATNRYKNPDNDKRGFWTSGDISVGPPILKNIYPITTPSGRIVMPPKGYSWRLSEERLAEFISENRIWFGHKGDGVPRIKRFISDVKDGVIAMTLWTHQEVGHTQDAKKELKEILHENNNPFETVKPIKLLDRILKLTTDNKKSYTILDFFAGSGSTLQATMQLNSEDAGNRQCILVTNNENNICEEVTYERNKRVIQGYTNDKGISVAGLSKNNLRYFKTSFVSRERTLKNKRQLTQLSTDVLRIKENCYTEIKGAKSIRIFNEDKLYLIVVFDDIVIPQAVEIIQQLPNKSIIKVYVFSEEQDPYTEDFYEVLDKIQLCALPDAIYKAYQHILPKKKRTEVEEINASPNLFN